MATEDKPKFTPGPWIIETSRYDETIIRTDYSEDRNVEAGRGWDEDIIIAEGIEWGLVDDEEIEANARLIAAVPDMYEALRGLLDRYVGLVNSGDAGFWDPEKEGAVSMARAALAKAEGRES